MLFFLFVPKNIKLECQKVWVPICSNILSGMIWVYDDDDELVFDLGLNWNCLQRLSAD